MKRYIDIKLPKDAADDYIKRLNKDDIDDFIYLDEKWYEQLLDNNTYYILGPKGSGKTLYAAYMCSCVRNSTRSKFYRIDVADYGKLIFMKNDNRLNYTVYVTMWKVILLQKILFGIDEDEIGIFGRAKKYGEIKKAISEYFGYDVSADTFNPVSFLDSCDKQIEVSEYVRNQISMAADAKISPISVSGAASTEQSQEEKELSKAGIEIKKEASVHTDVWLKSINAFETVMTNISFKCNHFLFVDGLDVRPKEIDASEYCHCISALVRAVYDINTYLLPKVNPRGKYFFKIVALTRTDIFINSDLVNATSCINDNCINMNWTLSNEIEFEYSDLYRMVNKVLSGSDKADQSPISTYFNFTVPDHGRDINAMLFIQRYTRQRPRDFIRFLRLVQDECKKRKVDNPSTAVLLSYDVNSKYSDYYNEQVRSEMIFRYSQEERNAIAALIRTVKYKGSAFTEIQFSDAYASFLKKRDELGRIFENYRDALDVMYTYDVIGWQEKSEYGTRVHWHYREAKAIDEESRLPWERIEIATSPRFIFHRGTGRN